MLAADTTAEYFPALALLDAVILSTLLPDPGDTRTDGAKTAETPRGKPVIVKETPALNPPLTVTLSVMLLFAPECTVIELAEGLTWKAGEGVASPK